ncbi:MAG: ribonuclease HI [bacterium]|nr:ribonuclease HI [bacterium]
MKSKSKKKYYAVFRGKVPGIYDQWFGPEGAEIQIREFPDARFKGFPSLEEAQAWYNHCLKTGSAPKTPGTSKSSSGSPRKRLNAKEELKNGKVVIYTDGGAIKNPGPGGYGVVLLHGGKRKELSGGFRRTTNNRMELTACIEGLKSLEEPSPVSLFSDSQYVVNGIEKGWAKRWKKKNWMRNQLDPAENADLWEQLLELCETHDVVFSWVKGHAGNKENERCDRLVNKASADSANQLPDEPYEAGRTAGLSAIKK